MKALIYQKKNEEKPVQKPLPVLKMATNGLQLTEVAAYKNF